MVGWVSRLLVLAVCLSVGACAHPVIAAPAPPVAVPQHVTKIVLDSDLDDSAEICANVTMLMLFRDPNAKGPVCVGLTVGDIRAWLQRLSRAD